MGAKKIENDGLLEKKKSSQLGSLKQKAKTHHKKIAESRGSKWKENLSIGKRDSMLNPSVMKIARLKLGLNQTVIAKKIDVSPSTFGSIERGRQPVKLASAKEISKVLRVPFDRLFKVSSGSKNRKKFLAIIQKQTV